MYVYIDSCWGLYFGPEACPETSPSSDHEPISRAMATPLPVPQGKVMAMSMLRYRYPRSPGIDLIDLID